jgi:hypothetical protein
MVVNREESDYETWTGDRGVKGFGAGAYDSGGLFRTLRDLLTDWI